MDPSSHMSNVKELSALFSILQIKGKGGDYRCHTVWHIS